MRELLTLILGLFCMTISSGLMGTTSSVAPSMVKALSRWQRMWKIAISKTGAGTVNTSGIERYSEEHCWTALRMLEAMASPEDIHPYLRRVGHNSLAEFHAFLVQAQRTC